MPDPIRPVTSAASAEPADLGELLLHADWLRALARRLVGGGDLARDLEQETWLAALEHPPRDAAAPRQWLAQVLRNLVRQHRRSESARRAREARVARPEAAASDEEAVDRAQALQTLLAVVLELDEPYRSTLLLRFQDGLAPAEIARRHGVPGSTVRNRIARGLADVRERLARRHGSAWSALLLPLVQDSLPAAAATAGGSALGASVAAFATMTSIKLVSAALAVLVLGAVLWWQLSDAPPQLPGASLAPPSVTAAPALDPPVAAPDSARAVVPDSTSQAKSGHSTPADTRGSIDVTVLWESDGTPASGVVVRTLAWGESGAFALAYSQVTDAEGRARFDNVASGSASVEPDRAEGEQVDVRGGETAQVTLRIPPGILVRGQVVDEAGAPVRAARIWLSQYGNGRVGAEVTTADAAGRFEVRDVGEARRIAARAAGFAPSPSLRVGGKPGDSVDLVLEMPPGGGELRGVVRGPDGMPVASASVQVGSEHVGLRPSKGGGEGYSPPPHRLTTDERGAFVLTGVAAGRTLVQCRARGFAPWSRGVEIAEEGPTELAIDLLPGAALAGTVRGAEGAPAAGVFLGLGPYGDFSSNSTRTSADGAFRLDGLAPGKTEVRIRGDGRGDADVEPTLIAGETVRLDVQLVKRGLVAGRVVDEQGAPLAGWRVGAIGSDHPGLHLRSATSDAEGKFALDNWPEKADALEVRKEGAWAGPPAHLVEKVEVGRTDYVLTVAAAASAKAVVVGRLLGPDGAVVQDALLTWSVRGSPQGFFVELSADTGEFRVQVPPGEYEFTAQSPNVGLLRVTDRSVGAGETLDLGVLRFATPGRVRVKLVGPSAEPGGPGGLDPRSVSVRLPQPGRMGSGEILLDEHLEGLSQPLGPGKYTIVVHGTTIRDSETPVEVLAGEERAVEVTVERATTRSFQVTWASGAPPEELFDFIVTDAEGRPYLQFQLPADPQGATRLGVSGLVVGSYRADVKTADGRSGSASFTVDDLTPEDPRRAPGRRPIEIQVR